MRNFYKPGCQEEDMDSSLEITDEGELFEDLDGDPDSENAAASPVDSDTDSSDDDFDPSEVDTDDSNGNLPTASTSRQAVAESSTNRHGENLEDDEEDETVRAIISAIKKPRTQPPEIKVDDFVTDLSFHPDNDILAIGLMTGDVLLYNYANDGNTLIKTLEIHDKAIRDVEFSEDGLTLLTGSKDKSIMITDVETEKLKQMYEKAHESSIYKLYIVDEHLFTTGDDSGTVKMWDIRSKDPIFSLKEVEDYISGMLTNDAKKLLLVTSGDGYLTTINIGARKMYVQSEPYDEELTCMGLYRNDSKLVVGTSKGKLYTFNWGQFGYHCDMFPGMKTPISAMLPITDRIGCVAGEEGILRAAHIAPFRNLGIVGQHSLPVETMDINHSGEFMASSSHNNDVQFWNIKYFEDFGDIKYNVRHNSHRERRHNLPSSKFSNASDFFADLAE